MHDEWQTPVNTVAGNKENYKNKQTSLGEHLLNSPDDEVTRALFNKESLSQFNHVILGGPWTWQIKGINLHCIHGLYYPTVDCVSCGSPGAHLFLSIFSAWMVDGISYQGYQYFKVLLSLISLIYLPRIFISDFTVSSYRKFGGFISFKRKLAFKIH